MNKQVKASMIRNIARGNRWIWQSFSQDFLISKETVWIKEFLNTPRVRVKSEEVTSKIKNDWIKLGLIDDNREKGAGWHKFTVSEIIWIKIVKNLKNFNFSNQKIKEVRNCLKFSSDECSISDMPYLDFFTTMATMGNVIQLAVTNEGEAYFITTYDMATLKQMTSFSDYISIDLNSIIKEVFPKITSNYTKVVELSEMEEKTIKSLREVKNIKSLQIEIKGNQIVQLEREVIEETSKKLIDIIKGIEYGDIKPIIHKGKISNIIRTEKFKPTKLKNKTA